MYYPPPPKNLEVNQSQNMKSTSKVILFTDSLFFFPNKVFSCLYLGRIFGLGPEIPLLQGEKETLSELTLCRTSPLSVAYPWSVSVYNISEMGMGPTVKGPYNYSSIAEASFPETRHPLGPIIPLCLLVGRYSENYLKNK